MDCSKDIWCGRKLMDGIKTFYREVNACVKVDDKLNDNFAFGVGGRQFYNYGFSLT